MTDFTQNLGGSQQLRNYRTMRRAGIDLSIAAERTGITIGEAKLIDADDAKSPPAAEAYQPLTAGPAVATKEIDMPKHDDVTETPEDNDPLIELAAETLRGDIRDSILSWFKAQPKAWPFMAEREQRDFADAADRYSRQLVKRVAQIIAAGERPCIVARLVEYKEKDGVEAKLKFPSTGDVVASLHEACGREVLVVTSGADEFMEEAGAPEIDADQPKFPDIGDEYNEAA